MNKQRQPEATKTVYPILRQIVNVQPNVFHAAAAKDLSRVFTPFFVFDSAIIFRRHGFATYALKPMPAATSLVQRQCVPISKVAGDGLSSVARNFSNPCFVTGTVVSVTAFGFPLALDITQIWGFLSPASIPIAA